jgi:hypothetical protein
MIAIDYVSEGSCQRIAEGRNIKVPWSKIILGFFILVATVLIFSLLVGADWILNAFLFFSNDILCQDRNDDGKDDFCQYWKAGELVRIDWDTNFDGEMDVWQVTEPDQEILKMDANFDGVVDYIETRPAQGASRVQLDTDFDGEFDRVEDLAVAEAEQTE